MQNRTGFSIRNIIRALRPLQDVTIDLAGQQITAKPNLADDARHVLEALTLTKEVQLESGGHGRVCEAPSMKTID